MGFFVYRHLGLLGCNIAIMKRFLPLFILTGLLFGQSFISNIFQYKLQPLSLKKGDDVVIVQTGDRIKTVMNDGRIINGSYVGISLSKQKIKIGGFWKHHNVLYKDIKSIQLGSKPKYVDAMLIGALSMYGLSYLLLDDYDSRRKKAQANSSSGQIWLYPNSFIRWYFYVPTGVYWGKLYSEKYTIIYSELLKITDGEWKIITTSSPAK